MIYLILFLIILLLPFIIKNKKLYCIIISLSIILMVGLRNVNLGLHDTIFMYIPYFKSISKLSLYGVFEFTRSMDTEFVFYLMSYFISLFTKNIQIYLSILSFIIYGLIGRHIYKYSKYPAISFIMLISLNYFGYGFYMLRHMVALAILTLAYDGLVEEKSLKFLIMTLVASLFHNSAILFLAMYPISKLKLKKQLYIPLILLVFIFVNVFGSNLLSIIFNLFSSSDHYYYYSIYGHGDTLTLFLLNFTLLIFLRLFANTKDKNEIINFKCQSVAVSLSMFVTYLSEFMRLASFFSIYSITSIPNAISNINNKLLKYTIVISLVATMILYFFVFSGRNNNIIPYKFYWEV